MEERTEMDFWRGAEWRCEGWTSWMDAASVDDISMQRERERERH